MAYRMPNNYRDDADESYSHEDDESVMDVSVDCGSVFEHDDEEEEVVTKDYHHDDDDDYSEDEEEEDYDPRHSRRGHHPTAAGTAAAAGSVDRRAHMQRRGSGRRPPPRAKSFDGDTRFGSARTTGGGGGSDHAGGRRPPSSSSRDRDGGSRRSAPLRSKSFSGEHGVGQQSMRSLGGPKMRRDTTHATSRLDKETIASNRARRLRAMGENTGSDVKLLRASASFANRGSSNSNSKSPLVDDHKDEPPHRQNSARSLERDNKHAPTTTRDRQPPRRTFSNDLSSLPPEERQYARTAARGVTRSKSLKAERPNLDKASKNVASRLQALRVSSGGPTTSTSTSRSGPSNRHRKDSASGETGIATSSPKAVALQW